MVERTIESFFENVPERSDIKTVHKREEEYAPLLGPIEYIIARYYLIYPRTTDDDVARALKNFKENYDGTFDGESLECALQVAAREGLKLYSKTRKISKHEFLLVIDYILWAISNRNWMGDERAYLKWICNFFELTDSEGKNSE